MSNSSLRGTPLAALSLITLCAGACGQRLLLKDSIAVPMEVSGALARTHLEEQISPAMIEALGGSLPETWPPEAAPLALDLPFDITIPVSQTSLGKVGEDLALLGSGEAEARLRRLDFILDAGDLNHPLVRGTLYLLPAAAQSPQDPEARNIGYLEGLGSGEGGLVFAPGGRRALKEALGQPSSVLSAELVMAYDSRRNPGFPTGTGHLDLTLYVDILK